VTKARLARSGDEDAMMPARLILALLVAALALAVAVAATQAGAAAAPCPIDPTATVPKNAWAPARRELLPPGASALRLCRYDGVRATRRFAGSREIAAAATIAQLAHDLDALPPYPRLALPCPFDDGSQIDVRAAYPGGERVSVEYDTTGCNRVSNGDVVAIANGYRDEALAVRLRRELTAGRWIWLR
jgi:hypothetical protein